VSFTTVVGLILLERRLQGKQKASGAAAGG